MDSDTPQEPTDDDPIDDSSGEGSSVDPVDDDSPMDQAALDALLEGGLTDSDDEDSVEENAGDAAPPVDDDSPMDQAALDALLEGGLTDSEDDDSTEENMSEAAPPVDDDAPMDQAALDALLEGGLADSGDDEVQPKPEMLDTQLLPGGLGADEEKSAESAVDTPIADEVEPSAQSSDGPYSPLTQEDIDSYSPSADIENAHTLSTYPSNPDRKIEKERITDETTLRAILGADYDKYQPVDDEKNVEEDSGGLLTQAELDAILASQSSSPPKSSPLEVSHVRPEIEKEPITDPDLLALLLGNETPASTPNEGEGEALDQEALDALLDSVGDIQGIEDTQSDDAATPEPESPSSTEKPSDEPDEGFSQDDIDALLSQQDSGPIEDAVDAFETSVQGSKPAEEAEATSVGQDDVDALLADHSGTASAEAPEDSTLADEESSVDQNEIDALLSAGPEAMETSIEGEEGSVDQSEIDALLEGGESGDESVLAEGESDEALVTENMEERLDLEESSVEAPQSAPDDVEDLLAELTTPQGEAAASTPVEVAPVADETPAANSEEVAGENVAAAGAAESAKEDTALSQDLLDQLLSEAKETEPDAPSPDKVPTEETAAAVDEDSDLVEAEPTDDEIDAPEEEPPAPKAGKKPRKAKVKHERSAIGEIVSADAKRIIVSVAAGFLTALSAFTYLYTHQLRELSPSTLTGGVEVQGLVRAMEIAENQIAQGQAPEAIVTLEEALVGAPASLERSDAEFMRIEALYLAMPQKVSDSDVDSVLGDIDGLLELAREHPNAPRAMYIKAKIYEAADNPIAARNVYQNTLMNFGQFVGTDQVLLDLGLLELDMGLTKEAQAHFERMMEDFPNSELMPSAQLYLADAYAGQGQNAEAKNRYTQIARAMSHEEIGAEAYGRLGEMAYNAGDYEEAIQVLETRLHTSTTTQGNDKVFLNLAKAYRAGNRLDDSRNILNELIDFFPAESVVMPEAYVELSQVLDDLGLAREAVRFATQTVERFPDNPMVLKNEGELLGKGGNTAAAGRALLAAHNAGANDSTLLLSAARHFRAAEELGRAEEILDELTDLYPTSAEGLEGTIERAWVYHESGRTQKALESLENLVTATEGQSRQLRVLDALGSFYKDLGLKTPVTQIYAQIASLTSESEVLANAAIAMLGAEAWDEGLTVAARVELPKLKPDTAYSFLTKQGETLMLIDSARALEKMELAFDSFPEERTREGDLNYLKANLATGRRARARGIVSEIERQSKLEDYDAGRLEEAAIVLGDYLLDHSDYRSAADAYGAVVSSVSFSGENADSPNSLSTDQQWAAYQRSIALQKSSQFVESLKLLDFVARSNSQWAAEAAAVATSVRIEMRLRGEKVPPPGNGGP